MKKQLTKKVRIGIIAILAIALSTPVAAVVFGGSNLGYGGYPDHSCFKPSKPLKPYSLDSQWEIDSYNSEVEAYNSEMSRYINCINDYVENGNNDIKRIREAVSSAIDEAKSDY